MQDEGWQNLRGILMCMSPCLQGPAPVNLCVNLCVSACVCVCTQGPAPVKGAGVVMYVTRNTTAAITDSHFKVCTRACHKARIHHHIFVFRITKTCARHAPHVYTLMGKRSTLAYQHAQGNNGSRASAMQV